MKDFFTRMFLDESDRPSSTRFIGAVVILGAMILLFYGKNDSAVIAFASGTALLGVGQVKSAAILASQTQAQAAKPPDTAAPKPDEKAKADAQEAVTKC